MSHFDEHFDLNLRPSTTYTLLMIVSCLFGIAAVWISVVPAIMAASLSLALLLYLADRMHAACLLLAPDAVLAITHRVAGWQLVRVDGEVDDVVLSDALPGDLIVTPALVVLRFCGARNQRYAVAIWHDSIDHDVHRRLRVFLRLGMPGQSGMTSGR